MSEIGKRVADEVKTLKQVRDELRVQMHLGKAEAKELWERMEQRWHDIEGKLDNAEKQAQDRGTCESWARQQTGYDPLTAGSAPPPSSSSGGSGVLGGAARGAAGGALIGALAGDAGKGAAIGAAGGGLFGGMRRQDQRRQDDAARSNYQAQQQQARSQYLRAFGACMEGKGYTVR